MKKKWFTLVEMLVWTILIWMLAIEIVRIVSSFNSLQDDSLANQFMINQTRQIKNYFEWSVISAKLISEQKNIQNIEKFKQTTEDAGNEIFLSFWKNDKMNFLRDKNNNPIILNDIPAWKYFLNTWKDADGNFMAVFKADDEEYNFLGNNLSLFAWKTQLEYIEDERWGIKYFIEIKNIPSNIDPNTKDIELSIETKFKWKEKKFIFIYSPYDF